MKSIKQREGLLYLRIANSIEHQIREEVLAIGDKLPSLRMICSMYGVSQGTALQAYYHLESKSLIEARPQSGYFVSNTLRRSLAIPQTSNPRAAMGKLSIEGLIEKVYSHAKPDHILLSHGSPAASLLPIARLNKGLVRAMRELKGSGTAYEPTQGNERLRKQIARWAFTLNQLTADDIISTAGCINAVSYCMMALTRPGDTIIVESPVYFGILQLAQSLGLKVLELPTHSQTGIEIDALKKTLRQQKVNLCLLVSNFGNPLGSCMPDEHKKEVVRLLAHYHVPLIEDDIYGDVFFGVQRPTTCKTYDEEGLVLWCCSVSKTLAPGYRVGWVAPGKFKEQVLRVKLFHAISSTSLTQEVIANFLETGRYEAHLRKMRHVLYSNCLQYIRAITDYFPEGTKVSRPQGGFMLWVELDKKVDTEELYERAIKKGISIAPGRMFTLQKQFDNCMRLNYGVGWNEEMEEVLKKLGGMVKSGL